MRSSWRFPGFQVSKFVYGKSPEGEPESTQYFYDGSYQVTRCFDNGKIKQSMRVAAVETPSGEEDLPISTYDWNSKNGQYEGVSLDYAPLETSNSETLWEKVDLLKKAHPFEVLKPTNPSMRKRVATTSELITPINKCLNTHNIGNGYGWWQSRGYRYFINDNSLPAYVKGGIARARWDVAVGPAVWTTTQNKCNFENQSNVSIAYDGNTSLPATASSNESYGMNIFDFGAMDQDGWEKWPTCYAALACTYYGFVGGTQFYAVHIRFNSREIWATDPNPNHPTDSFIIASVSAHEVGHSIGLGDLGSNECKTGNDTEDKGLTMYGCSSPSDTSPQYLGDGDVRGMRIIYPK